MVLLVFFHEHTTMRSWGAEKYTPLHRISLEQNIQAKTYTESGFQQTTKTHINSTITPFPHQVRNTNSHTLFYHKNTNPAHRYTTTREYHHYQFTNTIPSLQIQSNPHTDSHYIFIYNQQSIHRFTQNPQYIHGFT